MNLGIACWERLAGDPSENHERAIGGFEDSLSVWNAKDHPEDWATVQMNLGVAYRERGAGNRWENQERAIGAFAGALSVWSRERHPEHWAAARTSAFSIGSVSPAIARRTASRRLSRWRTPFRCGPAKRTRKGGRPLA